MSNIPATVALKYQAVLEYLKYGWWPIPVHYLRKGGCSCYRRDKCPTPGKHPTTQNWQEKPLSPEELQAWWLEDPNFNVGLVTGSGPGIVALDIDPLHGGLESLRALEDKYDLLPKTILSDTGGGGQHYLFEHPGEVFIPTRGHLLPGIDIRGQGGQIVAPPSIHKSQRRYHWREGHRPTQVKPAPMPVWLLDILESKEPEWLAEETPDLESATTYYSGNRNTNLFSLGRRLRVVKDLTPTDLEAMLHTLNETKCDPPLPPGEVDQIIRNVLRKGSSQTVVGADSAGTPAAAVRLLTVSEIWDETEKPLSYLAPGLLLEGEVAVLAAPTEAGKSMLAMAMSISVAAGKPVWGRGEPCTPRKVMYCTEELAGRTIKTRVKRLALGLGADRDLLEKNLLVLPQQNLTLAVRSQANLDAFFAVADRFRPDLVILDTYISYYGGEEKDSGENRAWFSAVPIALRARHGCAVIVQHHAKKPQSENGKKVPYRNKSDIDLVNDIRGTSDLGGVAERIWFMWKWHEEQNDYGPLFQITVRNVKAREGDKHTSLDLTIQDTSEGHTTITAVVERKSNKHKEREELFKTVLGGKTLAKKDLVAALEKAGLSQSVAYHWIGVFENCNVVKRDEKGFFSFVPAPALS